MPSQHELFGMKDLELTGSLIASLQRNLKVTLHIAEHVANPCKCIITYENAALCN